MPLVTVVALALAAPAVGQEPISLIDPGKPAGGWAFGNGPEFPGAKGELKLAAEPYRDKPVLSLHGDFTQGGNYVQAWVALPKTRAKALSFWVNSPAGSTRLPIRYTDDADKVRQINLKINEKGGWQRIVFPVEEFFRKMAAAPAAIGPGGTSSLSLTGKALAAQSVQTRCPPLWQASAKQAGEDRVDVTVQAPLSTPAREARVYVQLLSDGAVVGELAVPVRVARDD